MKTYSKVVFTLALLSVVLGLACPYLISSAHTELVVVGFALLAALPVAIVYIWRFGNKRETEGVN